MPTKRQRRTRARRGSVSPLEWAVMMDLDLPCPLSDEDKWYLLALRSPRTHRVECRELWALSRGEILADWIKKRPGRRPSWWWIFDGPRASQETIERNRWVGTYYACELEEPRKRLGGTGTPKYEVLNYVPDFDLGIPTLWVTPRDVEYYTDLAGEAVDPMRPPCFESQATYLKRHNLLTKAEEKQLKPKSFEPEILEPEWWSEDDD